MICTNLSRYKRTHENMCPLVYYNPSSEPMTPNTSQCLSLCCLFPSRPKSTTMQNHPHARKSTLICSRLSLKTETESDRPIKGLSIPSKTMKGKQKRKKKKGPCTFWCPGGKRVYSLTPFFLFLKSLKTNPYSHPTHQAAPVPSHQHSSPTHQQTRSRRLHQDSSPRCLRPGPGRILPARRPRSRASSGPP